MSKTTDWRWERNDLFKNNSWYVVEKGMLWTGSEVITISFEHGQSMDEDTVKYWRKSLQEFYDGATVLMEEEAREEDRHE